MARVYSTRFLIGAVFEGETVSHIIPAGYTAVVRDISAAQTGDGAGNVIQFAFIAAGGALVTYAYLTPTGPFSSVNDQLRLVLNAGDELVVGATASPSCDVTVSGYLLSLP